LEDSNQRTLKDRRKQPTPGLSRYTFFGQRRMFRRKEEQLKGGYIDRYSAGLFFLLLLTVGFNLLDSFFTMIILDYGGFELNPVVRSVIEVWGDKFWVWKFMIVSVSLVLLCLHSKFRRVKAAIMAASFIYIAIVLYQMSLFYFRIPKNP